MKVSLISSTPDALNLLLFTKQTRLQISPTLYEEVSNWPQEKKEAELEYMRNTIQSSWEFVDYVFCIEEVTRAFTHQLVRHRVGTSFAQQAQRVVDMEGFGYETGDSIKANPDAESWYENCMEGMSNDYGILMKYEGVKTQDARGILPTNIHTNIIFKANLRTLHDMALKRLCVKAQGEFQKVFRAIVDEVVKVHPWAQPFLKVYCAWGGTCCFPTLPVDECPTKKFVYNPLTGKSYGGDEAHSLVGIESAWRANFKEVQPVVKKEGE